MISKSIRPAAHPAKIFVVVVAAIFFFVCTWASCARWADFKYRTFDLAFYIQGIWQFLHGHFQVSILGVPLLGNHVDPIVFLFAPLFAIFRHPMLFVVVQNAALASMAPIGYDIARRLGLEPRSAALAAIAILITPAAGFIAIHEFHPEAFAAPFLLLIWRARLADKLFQHWLWFVAILACKENLAVLLIVYCIVQLIVERKRGLTVLRNWYLFPLLLAIIWLVACIKVISPALNAGNVDYVTLYEDVGSLGWNAIARPQPIVHALFQSLTHGNLVWALLLPFLFLPLLKLRWLFIALPILLQHLLSWRSSEWTIYFHYAAPLIPLFWIATVETVAASRFEFLRRVAPGLIVLACLIGQMFIGPANSIASTTEDFLSDKSEREHNSEFIKQISPNESVVASLPYLSHLATREQLYSLHFILKGLKTLSRESYTPPPPTDVVLINYDDPATFDPTAGYYHPQMKMSDGRVVPSSDRLLHLFLKRAHWTVENSNSCALFRRGEPSEPAEANYANSLFQIGGHTELLQLDKIGDVLSARQSLEIKLVWKFTGEREVIPWMVLRLIPIAGSGGAMITKGLCAPQIEAGVHEEVWHVTSANRLPPGEYLVEAIFLDNTKKAWSSAQGRLPAQSPLLAEPISLGQIKIEN